LNPRFIISAAFLSLSRSDCWRVCRKMNDDVSFGGLRRVVGASGGPLAHS
jgi:hypothetical protein